MYFQDKLNKKFNTKYLNELNRISVIAHYKECLPKIMARFSE